MILLVDNYDSFVYNLRRYFVRLNQPIEVLRNDAIDIEAVLAGRYQAVVISPGPKGPDDAGQCLELVRRGHDVVPMLGICLGHQIIWQALGGTIRRAHAPMHGVASPIAQSHASRLLQGIPQHFEAARYHSLSVEADAAPTDLTITAIADDGEVMAFEHRSLPLFGLQFHPESILTQYGYTMIRNFLNCSGCSSPAELPSSDLVGALTCSSRPIQPDGDGDPVAVLPGSQWF